jgi:hypothetical protein
VIDPEPASKIDFFPLGVGPPQIPMPIQAWQPGLSVNRGRPVAFFQKIQRRW